jgi:hypothetical protein
LGMASPKLVALELSATVVQTQPRISQILAASADGGVPVRLCFGDPSADAVAVRDREEGIAGTLAAKIRSSLTYYRALPAVDACGESTEAL